MGLMMLGFLLLMSAAQADSAPLLYRVRDGKGHEAYLLGTVHVGEESMYPLGENVERAFQAADVLAVEADLSEVTEDREILTQYTQALTLPAGDDISAHLSNETRALALSFLGGQGSTMNRMIPMAWYSIAEEKMYAQGGWSAQWGVDQVLLSRARREGKRIDSLEGWQRQAEIMRAVPDEIVEAELSSLLRDTPAAAAHFRALLDAWRQGDEGALTSLLEEEMVAFPPGIAEHREAYEDLLFTRRNAAFASRVEAYLSQGETALVAVGAAHVVGEEGLIRLLAQRGYAVEEIGR